jgi:hypothetical protein
MKDAERDLGTELDWVAVDHWNTDNSHVHVLVRGRADDGQDLVISRDYISQGFRGRAAERVTLELGPRSEREIRAGLENEANAERWTSLDRSLRDISDEGGGAADLRPGGAGEDPELRRLMIGRAAKLERLGLAEQVGPEYGSSSLASNRPCAISESVTTMAKSASFALAIPILSTDIGSCRKKHARRSAATIAQWRTWRAATPTASFISSIARAT